MSVPHVFGVRHLSPGGAWHLRRFLEEIRPTLVLVEGPSDANELIPDIVREDSVPPLAILAYTADLPVRTLHYPLARYSPEYIALRWAAKNGVEARFMDLPSGVFLGLQDREPVAVGTGEGEEAVEETPVRRSLYHRVAEHAGEADYESFWERRFEWLQQPGAYREAAFAFGHQLRETEANGSPDLAENLVREAWMRRCWKEAVAAGHAPERIVLVCGAYHAPVLAEGDLLDDAALATLPQREAKLTLMPYSYFRLSSQSGYGAGNRAPAYFEAVWQALEAGDPDRMPLHYLAGLVQQLREAGTPRSTAEVIEGVRLASTLASFKGHARPVLRDMQDAAITLLGHGHREPLAEAMARLEVGTAIGSLPDGVSRTSIQADFDRQLRELKLEKYRTTVREPLVLDLRENRTVKSESAAFLDLRRSSFLHRLAFLGVPFAVVAGAKQLDATWKETWSLQWTPEAEIALVESTLLGDTVELACGCQMRLQLDACESVAGAAHLMRKALECGMPQALEMARETVQALSTLSDDCEALAHAASELAILITDGDVRQYDAEPLLPLLAELFLGACLTLPAAARCDRDAALRLQKSMSRLDRIAIEFRHAVDRERWKSTLLELADADDLNPLLSGMACALCLEEGSLDDEDLSREVSRRLSPGIPADLGAGWFEGLASRNRAALLSRLSLWRSLADYVQELDEEAFRRALVFLRRAFADFSPNDRRSIAENLGEIRGFSAQQASAFVASELTTKEKDALDALEDLDLDDL